MAVVIIPARLTSSRLPEKVILDLNGKPVIRHVYDRILRCREVDALYIATDHEKVARVAREFTDNVILTEPDHPSGTDRIAEVARTCLSGDPVIVNVQGDEPFIEPAAIDHLIREMRHNEWEIGTMVHAIRSLEQLSNPNWVKCIWDRQGRALYFSRSPIPYLRDLPPDQWMTEEAHFRHVGVYAFHRTTLLKLAELAPSPLEIQEKLEQLRWLYHGFAIHIVLTEYEPIGIDTPDDLVKARIQLSGK
ncbi:MAG: 3-deoxy-manno-octulosonate cytidylyltransferase [Saprospiraceae bacterium]